ncbi:MAG: protein translocase subunit SecD [Acidobacteriota bacterium]|nr:protein translocase subunit SecD [Acidobacteriota bacterium]
MATSRFGVSTRNRVLTIIAVIALSLWAINPIQNSLKLGLDLNGGVQLVLRVKADEALLRQPQAGVTPDDIVEQALRTIERRVNELGVAEPVIQRYTAADQILVELPGVSDVDRAKQIIKSTAQLRLTPVEHGPFATREAALLAFNNALPSELEVLPGAAGTEEPSEPDRTLCYVVRRVPAVSGVDLRSARHSLDENNRPAVGFTLKPDAARRFGEFTAAHLHRPLATVLDNRVTSVATIQSRIDDEGQNAGVSREEMIQQVINLNSGALPADLEYVEERTIGASLGAASVRAGVLASLGGLSLVLVFLLGYYRLAGINALTSVVLNLLILLALMAYIPVTLTLPGIAGLILTIGMGVDSNVLIFERIKEELAASQAPRAAVRAAFRRVWLTLVDTHVTSLVAAAFLFQFGTSAIRGFATTLAIGLLANVFTAVFVSRTMFEIAVRPVRRSLGEGGAADTLSIGTSQLFANTGANFTRWRRHAVAFSLALVLAGGAAVATKGLPLGIDFTGGTLAVVEFTQDGVTEEQVRAAVAPLPGDEVVQRYGANADRQFMIRLPLASSGEGALEATVQQIRQALQTAGLPEFTFQKRDLVTAMIGEDLQRRGVYAVAASLAAIALYIGIRFRFAFAVGAIAATLHDVLVTLACLSLAGYDLTLNVVAALLTIVGYSVNDTIVIFDRVRENARQKPAQALDAVVNLSVNQTLSRTVITAGTTFLSVTALYVFGGEALQGFAFTMLVGIVAGTYSTVFIASAIAILLSQRSRGPAGLRSAARKPRSMLVSE